VGERYWQIFTLFSQAFGTLMKYLLDTNILIDYFRKKNKAKEVVIDIVRKGGVSISLITYGELLYGVYRARNPKRERGRIEGFISDFQVEIAQLDLDSISIYADVRHLLETKGRRLDEFDLLIGATAVASGYTFVTGNAKHFQRFPKLKLYN
jgi:tRNA(fMet)-specific endonuclease VapC